MFNNRTEPMKSTNCFVNKFSDVIFKGKSNSSYQSAKFSHFRIQIIILINSNKKRNRAQTLSIWASKYQDKTPFHEANRLNFLITDKSLPIIVTSSFSMDEKAVILPKYQKFSFSTYVSFNRGALIVKLRQLLLFVDVKAPILLLVLQIALDPETLTRFWTNFTDCIISSQPQIKFY